MSGVGLTGKIVPLNGGSFTVFDGGPVASLAALSLLAGCVTGTRVYVADQDEFYQLDVANAFALSSPLIVGATGGGRWFRKNKAYVVGNFTLWTCGLSPGGAFNQIAGYTPGQIAVTGTVTPDILLTSSGAMNSGTAWDICVDVLGNLWLSEVGVKSVFKILLKNALQTATIPADLIASFVLSPATGVDAVSFDKSNNIWISGSGAGQIVQKITQAQYQATASGISPVILGVVSVAGGQPQQIRFDHQGNLWLANNGSIRQLLASQLLVSNAALAPTVTWSGSNFTNVNGFAFGPDGRLWYVNYVAGAGSLRAVDPASPTGNPASVITITSASFIGANACCFDSQGNIWVVCNDNNTLVRINASQLTSSGAKVADSVVTTTAGVWNPATLVNITFPNNVDRSGLVSSGSPMG